MDVIQTKNYTMFKKMRGNRQILPHHVSKLAASIAESNLLDANPIIINDKLEVIDGQHRLQAAKKLGLPISYIVMPIGNVDDVRVLNTVVRRWSTNEYMESWIDQGREDYVTLKDFSEKYELSPTISAALLYSKNAWNHKENIMQAFRTGEFKALYLEEAEAFAQIVHQVRPYTEGLAWRGRTFLQALILVLRQTKPEVLLDKLKIFPDKIYARSTVIGYLRQFEDVVNYRAKNKTFLSNRARSEAYKDEALSGVKGL